MLETLYNNSDANPHVTLAQGIDQLSWSWEMQKKPKHIIQNCVFFPKLTGPANRKAPSLFWDI